MNTLIQAWLDAKAKAAEAQSAADQAHEDAFAAALPTTLRPATAADVVEGAVLWYPHWVDRKWAMVEEVLRPADQWKAYMADDGARYGLEGAFVEAVAGAASGEPHWPFGSAEAAENELGRVTPAQPQPVAWGLFAFIEGEGWVLQFPVRATQQLAEGDKAMYSPDSKLQVLPLTAGVGASEAPSIPCGPLEWRAAVTRVYVAARADSSLQTIPSELLEAMKNILLAAAGVEGRHGS